MGKPAAENEPSDLDEMTHQELRVMHREASSSMLFAKAVQWGAVGISMIIFTAAIFVDRSGRPLDAFDNLLSISIILFACGAIFMLFMYQMWQFNEIKRIRLIEAHFSSFTRRVNNVESRREKAVERYTMLVFKMALVIGSAVVAITAIR
jgi:hypothetical protein